MRERLTMRTLAMALFTFDNKTELPRLCGACFECSSFRHFERARGGNSAGPLRRE